MTFIFIAIGLAAGILSGMFGIGGGIVIVPALMYAARMQPQQAIASSLGALLLPVGILGVLAYQRAGHINVRASLLIALGLALGAYIGAKISLQLDATTLRKMFAVFLVLVAGKLWFN